MVTYSESSFSNACPWENGNGVQITGTTGKQMLGVRFGWQITSYLKESTVKLLCVSASDTFWRPVKF